LIVDLFVVLLLFSIAKLTKKADFPNALFSRFFAFLTRSVARFNFFFIILHCN